jgi:hypothetical protein
VTNVLPGSQGAVHCEGFVEVAWVARAAASGEDAVQGDLFRER